MNKSTAQTEPGALNKRSIGITITIVTVIFLALLLFIIMPVLSLSFISTLILIEVAAFLIMIILVIFDFKIKRVIWIPIIALLILLFQVFSSLSVFNANKYRDMIGEVKEKNFSYEMSPIDLTKLPVVDKELAQNLGEKKLGEQVALGSQVSLSEFTEIDVNGQLYWVAPLVHSGVFKWLSNREGTPGYIQISATNPQDIKLVQEVNGKKIKIKYQPQAFLGDDLHRKIYTSGFTKFGLTDFSFELDDEGKPYWVVTEYNNSIGISGSKVNGVIIVDAQTGETKEYDTNSIPKWVDIVIPADFAIKELNDWGKFVHGWWNPSDKDKLQATEGYNMIYNNGNCYYYTGLTSSGEDESTVGFILIDSRTKETTLYKISGSQETAAMASAEGKIQNLGYTSNFPILINVENEATYFMPLKDKKGLIKLYAMVNVKDYSIVGTGESLSKTKSNYLKYLKDRGDWQGLEKSGEKIIEKGTVLRIASSFIEDTTYYYIILKEKQDKIFLTSLSMSNELPLTKEGDSVEITYNKNSNSSIDLINFDNLQFTQTKGISEEKIIEEKEVLEEINE
ncbi:MULTISPECIES: cell shape-determining protein [Clostridium]|uniref:Cell shape-determining protein n=1 Tax=Clostridium thermopalmarium DSM 5974 TaxID=1121340 RepID=A0A2T0AKI9_9CLOT|nr:cell shape-determining protein [Clostridium thermopalmarium]PRR69098.1 hypothetical protein CPAL_26160 [Clostridium thermopalmarium DSM 5974]PVZ26551.1 hypothetical protein LX19_00625 [Clostridium thermopalmarium DSM 5974]